jgi:acyl-CoA thioesterase-1
MASLTKGYLEMSSMLPTGPRLRSYALWLGFLQIAIFCFGPAAPAPAQIGIPFGPYQVVALGDSLTAGYGLPLADGFVPRLQAALAAAGLPTNLQNAGVSGDTATDGLARLDWSVPDGTQAVILELGANDMLRGIKPEVTRQALDEILKRVSGRRIVVLLCGMRAAPNLGPDYGQAFERIYPDLAEKYHVPLYPFFLDGVAGNLSLLQRDGLHPNAEGVKVIVERMVPQVKELLLHTLIERPM